MKGNPAGKQSKKCAEANSVNNLAKEVFEVRRKNMQVSSYMQLKKKLMSVKEEFQLTTIKLAKNDSRIAKLNGKVVGQKASLAVKKQMVEEMHKVGSLETENESFKSTHNITRVILCVLFIQIYT